MKSVRVYVPRDATACALGADEVAEAVMREARTRGLDLELVRNGSRGAFFLEPMVETDVDGECSPAVMCVQD